MAPNRATPHVCSKPRIQKILGLQRLPDKRKQLFIQ